MKSYVSDNSVAQQYTLFSNLFHRCADPIVVLDHHRLVDCNPAALNLLGLDNKTSVLGSEASSLFPLKQPGGMRSADTLQHILQQARENGSHRTACQLADSKMPPLPLHITATWLDGETYYLQCQLQTQNDSNVMAAENALHQYEAILETTKDGYWMTDMQGNILEINEAYCIMSGYTAEQLHSMRIPDLEAIESPEETKAHIEYIIRQGNDTFETRHRHQDGSLYDVEVTVSFSSINGGRFFCLVRDISSRKQAEKSLQETMESLEASEQLLEEVINGTDDIIFYKDSEFRYLGCNRAFEKFIGLPRAQIIGKNDFELFDDETASLFREMDELMLAENRSRTNEEWITYPDGRRIHVQTAKSPFHYTTNRVGILGISRDITALTRLKEEQLEQQKLMLSHSKVAALGEMLGNIAHQWRQPLNVIGLKVQKLQRHAELGQTVEKETLDLCADGVVEQINYLSGTIDEFRSFFRSSGSETRLINLEETLKHLHSLVHDTLEHHYIQPIINAEECMIQLNESSLIQTLINIINNARDAFEEHSSSHQDRYLFITLEMKGEHAVLTVRDNAGGIPEDIIDKIFDPYFTTKPDNQGTGIGLYMSHQIVAKHLNGQINVSNREYAYQGKPMRGAEFTITLPCKAK